MQLESSVSERPIAGPNRVKASPDAFAFYQPKSAAMARWQDAGLAVADTKNSVGTTFDPATANSIHLGAEQAREWLALMPVGVVILNAEGIVIDANPLAVDMLGTPLLFQLWRDIIARSFAPRSDDGFEISLRDGRRVKLTTRALANAEGQLLTLTDLTDTRAAQAQTAQRERLAAMGEMIARLAHQLRTPLASAVLYAHQLVENSSGGQPANNMIKSERLLDRLQFMERQIADLLLVAGGGATLVEQIDIAGLIKAVAQQHGERLHAQQFRFVVEGETLRSRIYGNADALQGALANLIENAEQACRLNQAQTQTQAQTTAMHAEPPYEIRLSARRVHNSIEIRVSDNGPGMTEAVKARVLEPFYSTKRRGTGLGLAVVNAVVQSHQGELRIDSAPDQGCRFVLRFPVVRLHRVDEVAA